MPRRLTRCDQILTRLFCQLIDGRDVAQLLEVKYSDLTWYLYRRDMATNYTTFEIRKRSGGTRRISAPISALKILQEKLAYILQLVYRVRQPVHGFAVGRSIVTNASPHVGKSFVLNVDLEDFFPSINFGRVRGMFMAAPYDVPEGAATVLSQLCCYDNQLPQGAPTSPVVSNMVCGKMDSELNRLARRNHCVYTRYADDLTFSPKNPKVARFPRALVDIESFDTRMDVQAGQGLQQVIKESGFSINPKKLRLMRAAKSQVVTGLQVNTHVNVRQSWLRDLRGLLHAWERHGLDAAQQVFSEKYCAKRVNARLGDEYEPSLEHLVAGKLAFLRNVRGANDRRYRWLCNWFDRLREVPERYAYVQCREPADAVWVIEAEGRDDRSDEKCKQGTAFVVEDLGLVTCNHVVDGMASVEVFRHDSQDKRYAAVVERVDADRDLAILSADIPPSACLALGDSDSGQPSAQVTIIGYPDFAPGAQPSLLQASVREQRTEHGVRKIRFDRAITYGLSGGPVVDALGKVIGIAERGAIDQEQGERTARHNAIHVAELRSMIPQ